MHNRARFTQRLLAATALIVVAPATAFAQSNPAPETDQATPQAAEADSAPSAPENPGEDSGEIVVTGTLLRGVAPGGSQVLSLNQAQITATGATLTSQLLRSVPQAGSFLNFAAVRGSSNFALTVNRPTLRYLGNTSSSTNSTLLLVDGHRLPGMGVAQTTPDLDAIAVGSIERVEIVTDGGSSTYGSDAVGGVINFITRRTVDGIQARGGFGFGDDYQEYNASVTAGGSWDWGSAYISYDYTQHSEIYGYERDWWRSLDYINSAAAGVPVGANSQCTNPNIQFGAATFAYPGLTQGIGNRCDNSEFQTLYPRENKHTLFASLSANPGETVSFRITSFYVHRTDFSDAGPLVSTVALPTTSPFYVPVPGRVGTETVLFNLAPAIGNSTAQHTTLESWGVTPTFRFEIGSSWQLNLLANYGVGQSIFQGGLVNAAQLTGPATAGTFNPFNLNAAGNAAALAAATNWFQYGRGENTLMNSRAVLDGPLFHLPAGDVRVAFGAEYAWERFVGVTSRGVTAAGIDLLKDNKRTRHVESLFGEVNIPLLSEETGGVHGLSITASGRYDHYSDFGDTFNPRIGVNFEPVSWITLRGNYNHAFQAPGLSDLALAAASSFSAFQAVGARAFLDPATPVDPTNPNRNWLVALGGVISPLEPQTARIYSFGGDIRPPVVPGLSFGASYYHIDFKGQISIPPIFQPATFYPQFPDNYVLYTAGVAALQTYFNSLPATNSGTVLAGIPGGMNSVYAVIDDRAQNLARIITDGIDFNARYRHDTGFGAVFAAVSGTYILHFKNQANPNAAVLETVHLDTTRLRLTSNLGAEYGNLRGQVTWDHAQGYSTTPTAANLQQDHVSSFNTFGLFLQYNVPSISVLHDLSFTLNVENIFDQDPPAFRGTSNSLPGVANGFTLGRVVRFGISTSF